jgi:hypothetical protein
MRHAAMLKAALGAVLFAAPVLAQTSAYVRVEIPYAFHVGSQVLPAGEYAMKASATSLMVIENLGTRQTTLALAPQNPVAPGPSSAAAQVTFRTYGSMRFLSSILIPGTTEVRLGISPAEREVASNYGGGEAAVAALHAR